MANTIYNRNAGFRAPSTFHEKVQAFCEANDLTPSQVFRRATLAYIGAAASPAKALGPAKSRSLVDAL